MLIRKLHSNRQKLATIVLAVFSVVFICDFLCDFEVINGAHAKLENTSHEHDIALEGHHHDHESSAHDAELPAHMAHEHDESSFGECCSEEISQFYANLTIHQLPGFDLERNIGVLNMPWNLFFKARCIQKKINPSILNNALSPPLTGQYARIIFQSFLC